MTALGKQNYIHSCVKSFSKTREQEQSHNHKVKKRSKEKEIATEKQNKTFIVTIFLLIIFIFLMIIGTLFIKSSVFVKEKENAQLVNQISAMQSENDQLENSYNKEFNGQNYLDYVTNTLGMKQQHTVVYINTEQYLSEKEAENDK